MDARTITLTILAGSAFISGAWALVSAIAMVLAVAKKPNPNLKELAAIAILTAAGGFSIIAMFVLAES